jgi:hypothetical protein
MKYIGQEDQNVLANIQFAGGDTLFLTQIVQFTSESLTEKHFRKYYKTRFKKYCYFNSGENKS